MPRNVVQKYWGAMVVRGIIAILFAVFALFWTKYALGLLVVLFGVFVLVDGLVSIVGSFTTKEHENWWIYLLRGIVEIVLGIMIFTWPGITAIIFVYFIAIWAIILGIMEIWMSGKMAEDVGSKGMLMTLGIISLIFGIVLMLLPGSSLIIITWLIGLFALISGIGFVVFGFQIKNL